MKNLHPVLKEENYVLGFVVSSLEHNIIRVSSSAAKISLSLKSR